MDIIKWHNKWNRNESLQKEDFRCELLKEANVHDKLEHENEQESAKETLKM